VVIPLLYQYIVEPGWAEPSAFLLGLAIINSMPGKVHIFNPYHVLYRNTANTQCLSGCCSL
jgi:hypothetical protein